MDSSESGIWNLDVKKKFGRQKKSHEIGLGRGMKKIWTSKKNWSLESGRPKKNGVFGVWSLDVQKNLRRQKKIGEALPRPRRPRCMQLIRHGGGTLRKVEKIEQKVSRNFEPCTRRKKVDGYRRDNSSVVYVPLFISFLVMC